MPVLSYPFVRFNKNTPGPYIPIRLENPLSNVSRVFHALLDTGADESVIPANVCGSLLHNLKGKGVESLITSGVGGTDINTWKHSFVFELFDPETKKAIWRSPSILVSCVEHNNMPILLGRQDFLNFFNISFNYIDNRIQLQF